MPRTARVMPGGIVYHVLNRAVDRKTLFSSAVDFRSFEAILVEALDRHPLRIPAYQVMPNHFHLLVWPERDKQASKFMHYLETTHASRWRRDRDQVGNGHLYQSRFKSFAIQSDSHYLTVLRYIERNALRANLVRRAEDWPYSSLYRRLQPGASCDPVVCEGPVELPSDWPKLVNEPLTCDELSAVRRSIRHDRPFGTQAWQEQVRDAWGFKIETERRGRPRKTPTQK